MRVVSPLDKVSEMELLAEAGCDEVYCGVIDEQWRNLYPKEISPNRRNTFLANLKSFRELRQVTEIAHRLKKKVQFCANGFFYGCGIRSQLERAVDCGVDRVIVANIPTLFELRKKKFKTSICISSGASVLNSEAVNFYKELGADMIILPRDISFEEMGLLVQNNPGVDFEVFVKNEACANVGGVCSFMHTLNEPQERLAKGFVLSLINRLSRNKIILSKIKGKNKRFAIDKLRDFFHKGVVKPCTLKYKVSFLNRESRQEDLKKSLQDFFGSGRFFLDSCGACAIPFFLSLNLSACKIVGRGHTTEWKLKDIRFIRKAIEICRKNHDCGQNPQELKSIYQSVYGYPCQERCYYDS